MSYCRWSSDDWKCDLYCYADASGGFTTHVAGRKRVGDIPTVPDIREVSPDEWATAHNAQMEILGSLPLVPIGLAHDGTSFSDPDLQSFRARLVMLREAGYNFPDYVFEEIDDDIRKRDGV